MLAVDNNFCLKTYGVLLSSRDYLLVEKAKFLGLRIFWKFYHHIFDNLFFYYESINFVDHLFIQSLWRLSSSLAINIYFLSNLLSSSPLAAKASLQSLMELKWLFPLISVQYHVIKEFTTYATNPLFIF